MEFPLGIILTGIDVFLLIFVRMTGLFVISPIFGRRNIPVYLKIGFSLLLAIILINTIKPPELDYSENIYQYVFLVFKEFIVGVTLGFISYMAFTAIYIAGQLIDMLIGFGVVNVLDPMSNIQIPITANFYFIISMLVFLGVNGHHLLIKALFESYSIVPLGSARFNDNLVSDVLRIFGNMFFTGFKIAAPITAAVLIADVALGALSKTMPQLNVFVVGMPLKIILGIVVMMMTLTMFLLILEALFNGMNSDLIYFLRHLGGK